MMHRFSLTEKPSCLKWHEIPLVPSPAFHAVQGSAQELKLGDGPFLSSKSGDDGKATEGVLSTCVLPSRVAATKRDSRMLRKDSRTASPAHPTSSLVRAVCGRASAGDREHTRCWPGRDSSVKSLSR